MGVKESNPAPHKTAWVCPPVLSTFWVGSVFVPQFSHLISQIAIMMVPIDNNHVLTLSFSL